MLGESSPNQAEWDTYGARTFVIAHNAEEALSMSDFNTVTEIPMDKSMILCNEHAANDDF